MTKDKSLLVNQRSRLSSGLVDLYFDVDMKNKAVNKEESTQTEIAIAISESKRVKQ